METAVIMIGLGIAVDITSSDWRVVDDTEAVRGLVVESGVRLGIMKVALRKN